MKTAIIVSINFRVAHTSHLIASYKQMEELGYTSTLYISKNLIPYLPNNLNYVTSINQISDADVAIFWFPASGNLCLMRELNRRFKTKIIYVFHEPIEKFNTYREYGLSIIEMTKVYARYIFNLLLIKNSDYIILPSKKAINLYESSVARKIRTKYSYIPLMFDDEASKKPCEKRNFFSYIGTISEDHAFQQFLNFIYKATQDKTVPTDIKFLIATRNKVEKTQQLINIETSGRLLIIDGQPLTDEQINQAYSQSFLVWNAYHRSTQSGVFAKASMFGTPSIILKRNMSEFTNVGKNVTCIDNNESFSQIKSSMLEVWRNFDYFSKNSRNIFENIFYYRIHNKKIATLISLLY